MTRGSRALLAILAVSAITLAATGLWERLHESRAEPSRRFADLAAMRFLPGRVCGLDHAPLGPPEPRRWAPSALEAAREIRRAAEASATPQALRDLALLELATGELDRGILRLRLMTDHAPEDARLWSDLSAAYLARSRKNQGGSDAFLALAAADRAVQRAPGLPEARFNLALALDDASILHGARAAWEEYLRLDPGSPWSAEAARHLAELEAPVSEVEVDAEALRKALREAALKGDAGRLLALTRATPQKVRLHAEKELLAEWAQAWGDGQAQRADEVLRIARALGLALAEASRDFLLRDSVARIDAALAAPASGAAAALAEGHRLYGEGLALGSGHNARRALPRFARAAERLAAAGTPFAHRARLRAASCAKDMLDHAQVLRWLGEVGREEDLARYPNLAGDALWLRGVTHVSLAEPADGISLYEAALERFQATGEEENVASLHFLIAESLQLEGEAAAAWQHRYEALEIGRRHPTSIGQHNTLLDAAEAALREGKPGVALRMQEEMVENALAGGTLISQVEAFLARGRTWQRLGRADSARKDFQQARGRLDEMPPDAMRDRLEAELESALGRVLLASDPAAAAAHLGIAIDRFRAALPVRLPELLTERGRAWRAAGEPARAEEDVEAALREVEHQRSNLLGERLGGSYFERVREAFTAAVELQVKVRRDPRGGFRYAERLRDFLFSARGPGQAAGPEWGVEELQARLPADVTLVEYLVGADGLLVWILDREGLELVEVPGDPRALRREVEALYGALAGRASARDVAPLAARLHDALLGPVAPRLVPGRTLVVVPDAWLHLVPFAGLLDRRSGRYVVEDRPVVVAPSAGAYVAALERDGSRGGPAGRLLVVSDPAFDRKRFAGLGELPAARQEARRLADSYGAEVLSGAEATKSRFLERAAEHEWIHWAGHAEVNPDLPLLSYLVLAPEPGSGPLDPGDPGILYAHEIQRMRLPRTRLVVLAACRSGAAAGGEGLPGLALSFLAAGVPAVAGHLWPLEDGEAVALLDPFHEQLAAGHGPVAALRTAQLAALARADRSRPGSAGWAGFQVFAGIAPRRGGAAPVESAEPAESKDVH